MNTRSKTDKTAQGKPELPKGMLTQNYKGLIPASEKVNVDLRADHTFDVENDTNTIESTPESEPQAQPSPLPWSLQNGAIYDASDNGRVQNVRLCKLVVSSTAIEPTDAKLIVRAVNHAEALVEALREVQSKLGEYEGKGDRRQGEIIILAWEKTREALANWEGGESR